MKGARVNLYRKEKGERRRGKVTCNGIRGERACREIGTLR